MAGAGAGAGAGLQGSILGHEGYETVEQTVLKESHALPDKSVDDGSRFTHTTSKDCVSI